MDAQEVTTAVSRLHQLPLGEETRADAERYLVERARDYDPGEVAAPWVDLRQRPTERDLLADGDHVVEPLLGSPPR